MSLIDVVVGVLVWGELEGEEWFSIQWGKGVGQEWEDLDHMDPTLRGEASKYLFKDFHIIMHDISPAILRGQDLTPWPLSHLTLVHHLADLQETRARTSMGKPYQNHSTYCLSAEIVCNCLFCFFFGALSSESLIPTISLLLVMMTCSPKVPNTSFLLSAGAQHSHKSKTSKHLL